MASAARGADEEVFETPDFVEDDTLHPSSSSIPGRGGRGGRDAMKAASHTNKVPDGEVVSAFVPPQAAFEVFMGRTYAGKREDMSDAIGAYAAGFEGAVYAGDGYHRDSETVEKNAAATTTTTTAAATTTTATTTATATETINTGSTPTSAGAVGFPLDEAFPGGTVGVGSRTRRTGEGPVQRLVRLREETAMLAEDLEEMSKARKGGQQGVAESTGEEGKESGGYALWSAMAKETEDLKRKLALLSGDPKYKHILSSSSSTASRTADGEQALQQRLSEGVIKALERLREAGGGAGSGDSADSADPLTESKTNGSEQQDSYVTYDLFLKEAFEARRHVGVGQQGTRERDRSVGIPGVEARIAALERALGEGGGGGGGKNEKVPSSLPLADAVASLEGRISLLEPGRLDALRHRAQLAKSELDSLAKSRAVSVSSSSSSSSLPVSSSAAVARHKKKVEEAFATLQAWQGVSAGLPALVDRLRTLETLHLASATFLQRLEQLELSQIEVVSVLKSTSDGLEATLESSADNVSIVDENIKALDRRLAGVEGLST